MKFFNDGIFSKKQISVNDINVNNNIVKWKSYQSAMFIVRNNIILCIVYCLKACIVLCIRDVSGQSALYEWASVIFLFVC